MYYMKKIGKIALGIAVSICIIFAVFWGRFTYVSEYKVTTVDTSVSPDGKYKLILQAVGQADWPFGSASGRLLLYEGDNKISKADFELFDDGGCIRSSIWNVTWHEDCVEVILSGDEQFDEKVILYFDGKKEIKQLTDWKRDEEIENKEEIQQINPSADDVIESEQPEQTDESRLVSEELSGNQVQNRLDEERIIEEQSFQVELNDWGEVRFVSYKPDRAEGDMYSDVTFYLLKDNEILYQFPLCESSGSGYYWDMKFVMFMDTNADGKEDIVIGAEYMTGAGPQGAVPHTQVRIYEDYGDYFIYNGELSDKINDFLPWESNVLAKDVKRLIQLENGNEPLTNYESYTGTWRVSVGYIKAYEEPYPTTRKDLTCSISNGNEFCGTLFIEQETTERIASVENIVGTIQNGELFYDFTDDGWGGMGTLHIVFLPNQINVEVLNYQMAEENVIGYGISGNYEMSVRE
ncbi:MAG: hypothetical protein NC433_03280 [Clostridiales bacterium]|nr:hypothetical protein [Clostridiales bacterium]